MDASQKLIFDYLHAVFVSPTQYPRGAPEQVWRALCANWAGSARPAALCVACPRQRALAEAGAPKPGWNGRRIGAERASGILIAALGALEVFYGLGSE